MRKMFVAVALVAAGVAVSGCVPSVVYRVTAVSVSGAVSCVAGRSGRIVLVAPGRVRSIHIGDVCPG